MPAQESITSRVLRIAAACVFTLSFTAATAAAQCTIEWTGASGGNWNDVDRWNTGSVPADTDVVCIQVSGTYTVALNASPTIAALRLGGNSGEQTLSVTSGTLTLTGNGSVGTNGVINITAGNLDSGPGLTNEGLIVLASGSNKTLSGRLINEGTIRWDQGHIYLATNAVLENDGQFLVGGHSSGMYRTGTAPQRFVNNATVRRTAAGTSPLTLTFENNGLVDVQAGILQIRDESYHSGGAYSVAAGASLLFDSGTHTVGGTLSGNPQGGIVISSTVVAGDNGAVFNFGGTGLQWSSGNLDGGPGLTNEGLVVVTSGSNKTLRGRLTNEGTIRWDQGHIYLATNAVLENDGQFLVGGHSSGMYRTGTAPQRFVNNATVRRTAAGTSPLTLTFENNGLVDVQAGILRFNDESYHDDARLITAADASLLFDGGTHTISGDFEGTSAGAIAHSSTMTIEPGTSFDFGGNGFQWHSGTLDGGSGLINEGLIVLTTGSNKTLRGTLRNQGTIDWRQGHIYLATGALIENRETFQAASNSGIYQTGGAPQRFENFGTLLKVEPQTTSIINIEFDNRGSLDVSEGTLRFSGQSEHTDVTLEARADATLEFTGGTHLFTDIGLAVPSGATVTFGSGTRIIMGTLAGNVQGLVQWTSGTMRAGPAGGTIDISGTGLRWQGGSVTTPDGVLTNRGAVHMAGTASKNITSGTFRNEGAMTWTEGILNIFTEGVFDNGGSVVIDHGEGRIGPTFSPGSIRNEGRFERVAGEGLIDINPRFENRAEGELAIHSGTLRVRTLNNLAGAAISGDGGHLEVFGTFLNEGIISPGASPGLLSFNGTYHAGATAELRIEIGGAEPGASHDQFRVSGLASLDGLLDVRLLDGYRPADGTALTVLYMEPLMAAKTENTHPVYGGFRERRGLVDVPAGLALYPSITPEGIILTAGSVVELAAKISIEPDRLTSSGVRTVTITGEGFNPDVTTTLECVACGDPEGQAVIAGAVGTITPTEITVTFDLVQGDIYGDYEVVVRDPRGGEARAPMVIVEGPPYLVAAVLKEASADGRDPGIFIVRTNRVLRQPLTVPFALWGSGQMYVHYMTDVLGTSLTIPSGRDSVMMSVFPIAGGPDRTVELQLEYDQPPASGPLPAPPLWATMTLRGEVTSNEFRVLASSPQSGGNMGSVTLSIAGTGFSESTTVALSGGGSESLVPSHTEVNSTGTVVKATFDMAGQPTGARHVTVADGSNETVLANAFRVDAAIFPKVHVQMLAPPRVPRTRERVYTIVLYNEGNVDVSGHAILSGLPNNAEWDVKWHEMTGPGGRKVRWRDVAPVLMGENHMVIELPTLTLVAGESRKIEITAAINDPQQLELIAGWIYR